MIGRSNLRPGSFLQAVCQVSLQGRKCRGQAAQRARKQRKQKTKGDYASVHIAIEFSRGIESGSK